MATVLFYSSFVGGWAENGGVKAEHTNTDRAVVVIRGAAPVAHRKNNGYTSQ